MSIRRIIFILLFNDFNKWDNNKDNYNIDFKNTFNLKEEEELSLNKEIILLKDNNNPLNNFKSKKGTSFINIKELLIKLIFIKLLKFTLIKILKILFNILKLKARNYYNNKT